MFEKRQIHLFFLAVGLFVCASPGSAEDSRLAVVAGALSLRQALVYGVENNLDLRIAELAVPISHGDVVAAEAVFDPFLDASLDAQSRRTPVAGVAGDDDLLLHDAGAGVGVGKRFRSGLETRLGVETRRSAGDLDGTLDPEYHSALVLDLNQPLLRDRGVAVNSADLRVTGNQLRRTEYDALSRAQRIAEDVEVTYLELSLAQALLGLRRQGRDLAEELARGNRAKLDAGAVPVTEVQQAETAVASRDEQVVAAQQTVDVARAQLRELLNLGPEDSPGAAEMIVDALPGIGGDHPSREEALALALCRRPDLRAQELEIASQNLRLAYAENQILPRLDLTASLGLNGLSGSGVGGQAGPYGESLADTAGAEGYEWVAGVRFSYPLGNRAAVARRRQAKLRESQQIHRLKQLERSAEAEVATAWVEVTRSLERYGVAERFVALAERTLEQEQERLGAGLSDTFRILDFQADLIEARVRRATALADYHKGLARLYRAAASNLERYGIVYDLGAKEIPHV